jgi:molecular chaperone GrpE (heat shock protein)
MAFEGFKWFQRRKKKEADARLLIMEEFQGLKKLLRKQSMLIEEVHREQAALAANETRNTEPLLDLCDSIFYLHRAFQSPGLMSRQHAQVLDMVLHRVHLFAASEGVEMIFQEGTPFDPKLHEAVDNRNPGSQSLDVIEVVAPGYMEDGKVLRPAKVIVGAAIDSNSFPEGTAQS